MLFGVINVNKPAKLTSRDVVNRIVRRCPRKTKVGHAGTLDPLATGVLVVAIGPATRLIQYAQQSGKTYVGSFRLGQRSNTEDISGIVEPVPDAPRISESALKDALDQSIGDIQQVPPQFSAVKIGGQRAYKAARKGETVNIESRPVRIDALKLLSFEYPDFQLEIKCGKGTYVRTLGRDIAKSLGSDTVMTDLQRTGVGDYSIDLAYSLEEIESKPVEELMASPSSLVGHLPKILIDSRDREQLLHGKRLSATDRNINSNDSEFAAFDARDQLMAILERKSETELGTKINFVPQLFST